jgi:hypothetical protein
MAACIGEGMSDSAYDSAPGRWHGGLLQGWCRSGLLLADEGPLVLAFGPGGAGRIFRKINSGGEH